MLNFIRLALLAYVGHSFYQLYQSFSQRLTATQPQPGRRGELPARPLREDRERALETDPGRMMNMTGTGRGTTVSTNDAQGTSVSHLVGRGVV